MDHAASSPSACLPRSPSGGVAYVVALSLPVGAVAPGREAPEGARRHRPGATRASTRSPRPGPPRDAGGRESLKELEARQKERQQAHARDAHRAGGADWDKRKFYIGQPGLRRSSSALRAASWPRTIPSSARGRACSSARSACRAGCSRSCAGTRMKQVRRRTAERDGRHRARHPVGPAARRLHAHDRQRGRRSRCATEFRIGHGGAGHGHAHRRGRRASSMSACRCPRRTSSASSSASSRNRAATSRRRWATSPRCIRDRKKMRGKITAMSMEAKASAAIIGILPIAVGALVYVLEPRLHRAAVDDARAADRARGSAASLMVMRHLRDEEDDQLRHLRTRQHADPALMAEDRRSALPDDGCSPADRGRRDGAHHRHAAARREPAGQAHEGRRAASATASARASASGCRPEPADPGPRCARRPRPT